VSVVLLFVHRRLHGGLDLLSALLLIEIRDQNDADVFVVFRSTICKNKYECTIDQELTYTAA